MKAGIEIPKEQIAAFCRRWQVAELALFGSVLRDDFNPESDVDILVSFGATARHTLFDMVRMQDELSDILKRDVDLIERAAIEKSRNYIRRKEILKDPRVVYAA